MNKFTDSGVRQYWLDGLYKSELNTLYLMTAEPTKSDRVAGMESDFDSISMEFREQEGNCSDERRENEQQDVIEGINPQRRLDIKEQEQKRNIAGRNRE